MNIPLTIRHRTTSNESPYVVKDIRGTIVFYAKYEHEAIAFVRGVQFATAKVTELQTSSQAYQAFPDYDDEMPTLEGFFDSSYRHDVCPSLSKDFGDDKFIQIFCDYKNQARREWDDMKRFTVYIDQHEEPNFQSDDWAEIEQFIKELNK